MLQGMVLRLNVKSERDDRKLHEYLDFHLLFYNQNHTDHLVV